MPASRGRGEHVGLERSVILEAALRVVDHDGLGALTMRRVAAELDVEAMTLYHYIPNKGALLDGVIEQIVSEAVPPDLGGLSWADALRAYARSLRTALLAHPNAASLLASQPGVTTRNLDAMETMLEVVTAAGFTPQRALHIIRALAGFVLGSVLIEVHAEQPATADVSGSAPITDTAAYPLFMEAQRVADADPASRFEFVLDALLVGLGQSHDHEHFSPYSPA